MNKAHRAMQSSFIYDQSCQDFITHSDPKPEGEVKTDVVTVSGDCGLVAAFTLDSKATKHWLAGNNTAPVYVLGDKAKVQLSRIHCENICMSFNRIGKTIPTFAEASSIAGKILSNEAMFDKSEIIYNNFVYVIVLKSSF